MKKVFSTTTKIDVKKRRYIGQRSNEAKNYFNSLSTWDKICFEVRLLNLNNC